MEKVNERVDITKVFDFIIQNIMKLNKKQKIKNSKIVFKNDIIHIDMDNCIYTISSVMMYKRFIDKISYKYKVLLKYLPSLTENRLVNELLIQYYKNGQVSLLIKENEISIQ